MTIQNSARGRVNAPNVKGPDKRQRIAPNEITDSTAATAPNNKVLPEP